MRYLATIFFLVGLLDAYEVFRLSNMYESFLEEKIDKERQLAYIFLGISIILAAISYGA